MNNKKKKEDWPQIARCIWRKLFQPVQMLISCQTLLLFSHPVTQSCLTLRPTGLQHARLPTPSQSPGACSKSCPLTHWCHPAISSYVIPFSSCLQSFPASESLPMSRFFTSDGQRIGGSASESVLPMNHPKGRFTLGLTGLNSLQSKGLSRVCSSTTVWKHQFLGAQSSLWSNSHLYTWL